MKTLTSLVAASAAALLTLAGFAPRPAAAQVHRNRSHRVVRTVRRTGTVFAGGGAGLSAVYRGGGRNFSVSGDNNYITITGSAGALTVRGTGNRVTVDSARSIAVSGSGNRVYWRRGSPRTRVASSGNTVERR